jgi:hypothetical protein
MMYEVGKTYTVPSILLRSMRGEEERWVPVLLPPHNDTEFCFDTPSIHVHPDFRFWPDEENTPPIDFTLVLPVPPRIIWRDMVCTRLINDQDGHPGFVFPMLAMLKKFQNHNLKDSCQRCPHRGIDLSTMQPNANGIVRCPAHGLDWNMKTGNLAYKGIYVLRLKDHPNMDVSASFDPTFIAQEELDFDPVLQLVHYETRTVLAEKRIEHVFMMEDDKLSINGHKNCPRENDA